MSNTISNPVLIKTLPMVTIAKSTVTLKSYDDLFYEMQGLAGKWKSLVLNVQFLITAILSI